MFATLEKRDKQFIFDHQDLIEQEKFEEFFNFKELLPKWFQYDNHYKNIIEYFYNDLGVNILEYMTNIPNYLFQDVILEELIIPNNIQLQNNKGFLGCLSKRVLINNDIDIISNFSFMYCEKLKEIILPLNIKQVGDKAFSNCYSLNSISIPMCEKIGEKSFMDCKSIEIIDLPKCIDIDELAFNGCDKLRKVYIPKCEQIGYCSFYNCESLEEITISKKAMYQFEYSGININQTKVNFV